MSSALPSLCFTRCSVWNCENIPGYREIILRVPRQCKLCRRDSKGIYARARSGDVHNIVGFDVPAEAPEAPDLGPENDGDLDIASAVDRIWPIRAARMARVSGSRRASSPSKRRRNLWNRWLLPRTGGVLPQVRFSVVIGARMPPACSRRHHRSSLGSGRVIVRSSARGEDGAAGSSQAGRYDSVLGVVGSAAVAQGNRPGH